MQAERAHEHTHSPTGLPEVAGRSRNPSPNAQTHTVHSSQEWRGASGRTQEHTHSPTAQPGVAGRRQNPSPSTHTHNAHPSEGWRGAAQT